MGQKIVGWFAILVGLVLVSHNVLVIRAILGRDSLVATEYPLVALRGVLAAGGAVLVYFGLARLRRPRPPVVRKDSAGRPDAGRDRDRSS